jgi:hypothetical protein
MSHDGGGDRQPEAVGGQLIIPIAALAFTLYYFSTILRSPWEAQVAAFFVGAVLIGLILAFVARTIARLRAGVADLRLGDLMGSGSLAVRRLALFGLTIGYLVVIPYLGFTITTFVFLAGGMLLLGANRHPGRTIAIAGAIALAGYLLFVVAFETRFPRGPFERLMAGLF